MPEFNNSNGPKAQSNNTNGHTAATNGLHTKAINLPGVTGVRLDQLLDEPPIPPPSKPKKRRGLKFTRLADVQRERVRWLWPDRIASKLVLFTGLPDCGKTTAAIDIVARVTTARRWPDGAGNAPLGSVIFMTAEDGLADTIRTRADAAGADSTRVHCLDTVTELVQSGARSRPPCRIRASNRRRGADRD
jgi:AAA domain